MRIAQIIPLILLCLSRPTFAEEPLILQFSGAIAVERGTATALPEDPIQAASGFRLRLTSEFPGLDGSISATPPLSPQRSALAEVAMVWKPVAGASAYVLEIAEDPDFRKAVSQLRTLGTTYIWRAPHPGVWHWRISALGPDAQEKTRLEARSVHYGTGTDPARNLKLGADSEELRASWQGQSTRYLVELASDAAFQHILDKSEVDRGEYRHIRPAPGRYWLRVTSLDMHGAPGPISDAVHLEIKPPFWQRLIPSLANQ